MRGSSSNASNTGRWQQLIFDKPIQSESTPVSELALIIKLYNHRCVLNRTRVTSQHQKRKHLIRNQKFTEIIDKAGARVRFHKMHRQNHSRETLLRK